MITHSLMGIDLSWCFWKRWNRVYSGASKSARIGLQKRWDRSLVPLKNFQTFHLFFFTFPPLWPLIFGLPLLYFRCFPLIHIFSPSPSPSPSSLTHFPSSSLLLYSKPTIFFSKISNTKILPKTTNPTQSKVSLSSSHFYFVAIFVYIFFVKFLVFYFWFWLKFSLGYVYIFV